MALTVRGPRKFGELNDNEFDLYDFRGGLNIKKTPQQLDDTELTVATNVYLRFEGGIEMRKGMTTRGASLSATAGLGIAYLYQQTVNGAPQSTPPTFIIAQVGTNIYNATSGAILGVVSAGSLAMQAIRIYDPQHTGGGSDILIFTTGAGGPYAFDGTSVYTLPLSNPSSAAGARWCALVNGVVWFGGMASQPNLLVGTIVGSPETDPFYQQFALSQPITGLATLGEGAQAGLVAGHVHGFTVTYGVGPSNFVQQEFPATDGCAAGRAMIAIDGVLYFLGARGIYRFDGQSMTSIGDNIEPWILNDPQNPEYPMAGNRSLSWAFEYNRRLHVVFDAGPGYPNTMFVFDLRLGGWTVITGPNLVGAAYLDAPQDARPLQLVVLDSTKGQAYNWDQYNGLGSSAHNVDDAGATITATVITKAFKIGYPGTRKKLRRAYPELFIEQFSGTFTVTTDYGGVTSSGTSASPGTAGFTWDQNFWDMALWSGTALGYLKTRVDLNVQGEAFAFGLTTSDTNPPWRFIGLSGVYAQEGRN